MIYEDGLYAFVICDNRDESRMKDYISQKVPSYMVPKQIVFIDNIPISGSGKVDITYLKSLLVSDNKEEVNTAEEKPLLYEILSEYYDGGSVSRDDNLYAIGMESLDILLFIEKVRDKYIDSEREDEFYKEALSKVNHLTIGDIEKTVVKFGGKI